MIEDIRAPLFVTVDDYFRIGIRSKLMPLTLQFRSQLFVIVNFAVKNYPYGFFCVRHRLMTASEVNDQYSPESDTDRALEKVALVIVTTMRNRFGHPSYRVRCYRCASN